MLEYVLRKATRDDVEFLVETIIEAEKSGTDRLSYATVFGLEEAAVKKYLELILKEEIEGCELSISSFLVTEVNGKAVAAISAWIEGLNGIPSAILKGNLLNHFLPKDCLIKAAAAHAIIREIHIEYSSRSIQIGAGYVSPEFRGYNLLSILNEEVIKRISLSRPEITDAYAQIFSCNSPSIKIYIKANFEVKLIKEATNNEILNYLPSNKKILMKKNLGKT